MLKKIICRGVAMVLIMSGAFYLPANVIAQNVRPESIGNAPPIPARLLHEFNDEDDEILALGQFVKLEGATVTIRNANYVESTLKLDDLCREDKRWVNKQVAQQKKDKRAAEEAGQIWLTVDKNKPRTVIKACNRLKSLGRAAGQQAANVRALFVIDDERTKLACLATYAHICKLDMQSLKILVGEVTKDQNGAYAVVANRPGPFLEGIASMDYLGLLYLRHVAYTGELKAEVGWDDAVDEPVALQFSQGPENTARLAAIEAIGEIKSEEAAATLLNLAPVVEAPINGKRDDAMISALLKSLGNIGVNNGEVVAILKRYEQDFPKITAKALEQIGEN